MDSVAQPQDILQGHVTHQPEMQPVHQPLFHGQPIPKAVLRTDLLPSAASAPLNFSTGTSASISSPYIKTPIHSSSSDLLTLVQQSPPSHTLQQSPHHSNASYVQQRRLSAAAAGHDVAAVKRESPTLPSTAGQLPTSQQPSLSHIEEAMHGIVPYDGSEADVGGGNVVTVANIIKKSQPTAMLATKTAASVSNAAAKFIARAPNSKTVAKLRTIVQQPTGVDFKGTLSEVQKKPAGAAGLRAGSKGSPRGGKYPAKYQCDTCGKVFNQSGNLNRHKVVHTRDRPFKCNVCGKGFSQKSHVRTHQTVHTGTKAFECHFCSKRFSQLGHLNGHLDRHRKMEDTGDIGVDPNEHELPAGAKVSIVLTSSSRDNGYSVQTTPNGRNARVRGYKSPRKSSTPPPIKTEEGVEDDDHASANTSDSGSEDVYTFAKGSLSKIPKAEIKMPLPSTD